MASGNQVKKSTQMKNYLQMLLLTFYSFNQVI